MRACFGWLPFVVWVGKVSSPEKTDLLTTQNQETKISKHMASYGDRYHFRFSNVYRSCKKYFILHFLAVALVIYLLYALAGGKTYRVNPALAFASGTSLVLAFLAI